jgi:transposase
MLCTLEIGQIVGLKKSGKSNREIARVTGNDRKSISEAWNRYKRLESELGQEGTDLKAIQSLMTEERKRASRAGVRTKYTPETEARLGEIVEEEIAKKRTLGATHKQTRTNLQIHQLLESEGFDVSRALVNAELAKLRRNAKECFIMQRYELGDRMEYDFGQVRLDCGGGVKTYHMAVFSSPGGKWRWARLYTNEKIGVFLDSHVKMFELLGGVCREVVYDNMRNVVTKFLGKGEKTLNPELTKMALYYGYIINVTNCFSGNEKGHVEESVKIIRNKFFTGNIHFADLESANEYLESQLKKHNEGSLLKEEKQCLQAYRPPYELSMISEHKVDKMGMVCVDTCRYSVPDHLVGELVVIKKYHDEIRVYPGGKYAGEIYAPNDLVCKHRRIFGKGNVSVDIYHYLDTLKKKPGALRNSVALKSIPKLKAIFDTHFSDEPKRFVELFAQNREKNISEIVTMFEEVVKSPALQAIEVLGETTDAVSSARAIAAKYNALVMRGGVA